MGYHTEFSGRFDLDRPLAPEHAAFLRAFNRSRRMKRDASKASELPDPERIAAGLPIGEEGAYYVGSAIVNHGQNDDSSVLDHNEPPAGQPSLWCQWIPSPSDFPRSGTPFGVCQLDCDSIEWDEGEKFYDYIEWLEYLIEHFLKPWGYVVNGSVDWSGEQRDDSGRIRVIDNVVHTSLASFTYPDLPSGE